MEANTPITVFCIYARKDKALLDKLTRHFASLQKMGSLTLWSDAEILPGAVWKEEIARQLENAQIILLLISSDFMASKECYDHELQHAMERHKRRSTRVIPILLRSVAWEDALFSQLQMLPSGAKPVTSWSNEDEAFADIVRNVRKVVDILGKNSVVSDKVLPLIKPSQIRPLIWRTLFVLGLLSGAGLGVFYALHPGRITKGTNQRDNQQNAAVTPTKVQYNVNPTISAISSTPTNSAGGASGEWYDGQNPRNCASSAKAAASAPLSSTQGTLVLFYSFACHTVWARIYFGGPDLQDGETSNATITRNDGLSYSCDSPGGNQSVQSGQRFCFTSMIYVGSSGFVQAFATFHSNARQETLNCQTEKIQEATLTQSP